MKVTRSINGGEPETFDIEVGFEDDDSHLPCFYCGRDITREQQRAGERRYVGGDVCMYVHAECLKRRQQSAPRPSD